jgi:hypothetical protein
MLHFLDTAETMEAKKSGAAACPLLPIEQIAEALIFLITALKLHV